MGDLFFEIFSLHRIFYLIQSQCQIKQRKGHMAEKKTTKKSPVKKTSVKKTPAKKVVTPKAAPVVETHACACGNDCPCGCKCHKCGFIKKLLLILIIFALGFASASMFNCKGKPQMPRPEFKDGCMVVSCPKMAEMAPKMDADKNGCVSVEEFKAFKKNTVRKGRRPHAPKPAEPVPAPQVVAE